MSVCDVAIWEAGYHYYLNVEQGVRVLIVLGFWSVGARNANHVTDHQKLFTFELTYKDDQEIQQLLSEARQPKGDCYSWERGGKF